MPSCSLSRSLASTLQSPLLHHHAQLSKPSIHLLPLPNQLSPSSPAIEVIATASEAVSLANAAAEAARDALQLSYALTEIDLTSGLGFEQRDSCMKERRRRRRQRRGAELDFGDKDNVEGRGLAESCLSKIERSRYLTRDQEAEFSTCLKVDAMIEVPSSRKSSSGAATMMRRRRNERALLRARECRERITMSYKRLVVSVAAAYQGKGLSLQDLIQSHGAGERKETPTCYKCQKKEHYRDECQLNKHGMKKKWKKSKKESSNSSEPDCSSSEASEHEKLKFAS